MINAEPLIKVEARELLERIRRHPQQLTRVRQQGWNNLCNELAKAIVVPGLNPVIIICREYDTRDEFGMVMHVVSFEASPGPYQHTKEPYRIPLPDQEVYYADDRSYDLYAQ